MKQKKVEFAARIVNAYRKLRAPELPDGIEILNPYREHEVLRLMQEFYSRYYGPDRTRIFILGINPGRFGAGLTGIPFTDPAQLAGLGFRHSLPMRPELSSGFVNEVISRFGGMKKFASGFLLSAVCPLGFVKDGKNFNYYDRPDLMQNLQPFIKKWMKFQIEAGMFRPVALCLGEGSNLKHLSAMNQKEGWFDEIVALPHPRYIMQYRRKDVEYWIDTYVARLKSLSVLLKIK